MSDASEIASEEGVDPSDVEIISVNEHNVDEHTVSRTVTYRISRRAIQSEIDSFIRINEITDVRAYVAFNDHLEMAYKTMIMGSVNQIKCLRNAMKKALNALHIEQIPVSAPTWYMQLEWSRSYNLAEFHPSVVPSQRSGCYVFSYGDVLVPSSNVLYVGRAANLRTRLNTYFQHIRNPKPTNHKGANLLAGFAAEHGAEELFVKWAPLVKYRDIEGDLQFYLMPHYCSRDEIVSLEDSDKFDEIT